MRRELTYTVTGVPVTGVSVKTADGTSVSAGQTLRLTDPSAVGLTVSVLPANATVNSVSLSVEDATVLTVSGSGTSWKASAGTGRFGRTKIRIRVSGLEEYSFDIPVEVSHVVNVTLTEGKTAKGAPSFSASHSDDAAASSSATVTGSWNATYTGKCYYYEATGGRWNPSEENQTATYNGQAGGEFSWNVSSRSKTLFDLDEQKAAVEEMYETSSWWDDGNPAGGCS